ncbi:MAG TPA: flagellar motor protein MotB [Granulicella sp.]|jgi:chemotaxis protein MotB|nr:flagellar motor protein MotB [Granulicella sp.]
MRRKKENKGNHERWLVSYADFVTMIFALFVVLFASARRDTARQADMATAIAAAFTQLGLFAPHSTTPPLNSQKAASNKVITVTAASNSDFVGTAQQRTDLLALKKRLEGELASEIQSQTVTLRMSKDGLVISLLEAGFFDSGSAMYKPTSVPIIERIAGRLKQLPNELRIEGHTDDVPIHSFQFASNWELSTGRASTIARLLIEQYQFNPEKLSAAGYAQYRPFASNGDETGRAHNRRVDIVVLPSAAGVVPPVHASESAN